MWGGTTNEIIGGLLGSAGIVGGLVSLIALIRPLRRLWLPTRKRAALALASSFILFGIGGSLLPGESPDQAVVVNQLDLRWELDGDDLLLAIDTDLPDEGELSVSVGRHYFRVGKGEPYNRDYFSEFEPVSRWREQRRISLDAAAWETRLHSASSRDVQIPKPRL